jgi:Pyruvate/2-oxoacid:ferredoxin oxidoreductase delta subunit
MMGEPALQVRRFMAAEGMAPAGRTPPDHVSIELAFMAYLTSREASSWEADNGERAIYYLGREERFLSEHLMRWLPQFCHRLLAGRPVAHYADLARRAESFVATDLVEIQTWSGQVADDGSSGVEPRQWWNVRVRAGCTLCSICVQVCWPGALQSVLREEAAVLFYEASLCDGCAACERWCPEGTIHVDHIDECPPGGELVRSDKLACPRCGGLYAPASMMDNIQERLGEVSEAMLQRLMMCPDCKARSTRLSVKRAGRDRQENPTKDRVDPQGRSR